MPTSSAPLMLNASTFVYGFLVASKHRLTAAGCKYGVTVKKFVANRIRTCVGRPKKLTLTYSKGSAGRQCLE